MNAIIRRKDNLNKPSSHWELALAVIIWSTVFWLMLYFASKIPNPGETGSLFWGENYLIFLSAMVLVASTLYLVDVYVRYTLSIASLFGLTLIFAVVDHYANQITVSTPYTIFLVDLAILGIAFNLGKLVGLLVNQRSFIVPLALVAAVADLWSVFAGPTSKIIEVPDYYRYFLISYPQLGSTVLSPIIGIGDFTFLALFLTLIPRFELNARSTSWGIIISFIVALFLSTISNKGIPVVPFMATAFLVTNWKLLEFKKNDIRTTFIFIVLFLVIVITFTHLAKPRIKNIVPPESTQKTLSGRTTNLAVDSTVTKP